MPDSPIRIGIIDSGIRTDCPRVRQYNDLSYTGIQDQLGHGADIAEWLADSSVPVSLYIAKVFATQLTCTSQRIADALAWMHEAEVHIVNMSFGLLADRNAIREQISRNATHAPIYVAASPAQGQAVYPAAYHNVISVSADGRCQNQQISELRSPLAEFGASPRASNKATVGSSMACAVLSRRLAEIMHSEHRPLSLAECRHALRQHAVIKRRNPIIDKLQKRTLHNTC